MGRFHVAAAIIKRVQPMLKNLEINRDKKRGFGTISRSEKDPEK